MAGMIPREPRIWYVHMFMFTCKNSMRSWRSSTGYQLEVASSDVMLFIHSMSCPPINRLYNP